MAERTIPNIEEDAQIRRAKAIIEQLKDLTPTQRLVVLLNVLINMVEAEYYIVQEIKKQLREITYTRPR